MPTALSSCTDAATSSILAPSQHITYIAFGDARTVEMKTLRSIVTLSAFVER